MRKLQWLFFAVATALPTGAFAHTGQHDDFGLASGMMHPLLGVDHLLAMVAVGLLAGMLGGKSLWLLPATFVASLLIGAMIGLTNIEVSYIEPLVVLSVVALGLGIVLVSQLRLSFILPAVALFGIFHGLAHGLEAPSNTGVASYFLGFTLATALLHGVGISFAAFSSPLLKKSIGLTIAAVGTMLAFSI